MKNLPAFLILLPFLLFAQPDSLPEEVRDMPPARKVLEKNFILIQGNGTVEASFHQALNLLDQPDLLLSVQAAYSDLLKEGEEPEFVITEEAPGTYRYVNREEQKTEIRELHRKPNEKGEKIVVLYSKGERSFGSFQALTHVRVYAHPELPGHTQWSVQVFAYPENGFSRFFARTFGLAQRYFDRKTADLSELVTRICLHLLQPA